MLLMSFVLNIVQHFTKVCLKVFFGFVFGLISRVHGEGACSCPGDTGGSWMEWTGQFHLSTAPQHFFDPACCVQCACMRSDASATVQSQGQLGHMEPSQDDVSSSPVLCLAG